MIKPIRAQRFDWTFWLACTLALLSLAAFGGYYYYDRYVHVSEQAADQQAQHLEDMVLKNPQNADLRVATAAFYLDKGLVDQAIVQAGEALKINPNHMEAIVLLGRAYATKGDNAGAIATYQQLIDRYKDNPLAQLDPRMELVYYQLGVLYDKQGDNDKALAAFKQATVINRTDSDALYMLGTAYQKANDHTQAVAAFQNAVRFVPDFTEAYQGMVKSYSALGKIPEANIARAMAQLSQGDAAAAATQFEALVKDNPGLTSAYLGLGLAYEKLNRRAEAAAALKTYLATNPQDIAASQALGRVSQESK
ncbi:MAG: tetratricopeptide repeat protein [Chloroflexi bacterium]|nr:tetratricopeptide repeat protein [Chloroflexota bacterium]